MYSLGIIIFELFYNMKTHFERRVVLNELRSEGKFPLDFNKRVGKASEEVKINFTNFKREKKKIQFLF